MTQTPTQPPPSKRTSRSRSDAKKSAAATTSIPQIPPPPPAPSAKSPSTPQQPPTGDNMSTVSTPTTTTTQQLVSNIGPSSKTDDGGLNPYLLLIFKRIRRLKKKITRVKSTEATLSSDPSMKDKMEPDQLVALEKKLETSAPLKELEELFKAMSVQQASDKQEQKKQLEAYQQDIQRAQETASKAAQDSATTAFIQLIRLFYAVEQLEGAADLTFPQTHCLEALDKLRIRLFEVAQAAALSDDEVNPRQELYSMVHKLGDKSTESVAEGGDITYKNIFDKLDFVTSHPSAELESRMPQIVFGDHHVGDPSAEKTQVGKEDDGDGASEQSLSSEPTSATAQKSRATVESWFNRISTTDAAPSESPPKPTPAPGTQPIPQETNPEQAEPEPVAKARPSQEVATQTDPIVAGDQSSQTIAAISLPPRMVPVMPVHPMPDYRFVIPPWVGGTSAPGPGQAYPMDSHLTAHNPPLPQAQQDHPSMHLSNEPVHFTSSPPDNKESFSRAAPLAGDSDPVNERRQYDKGGPRRRNSHSGTGSPQENPGARTRRMSQESYRHSGDDRRLDVIYEDEVKNYRCGPDIAGPGQYVSYYAGPVCQEPEQLQTLDANLRGAQERVVACAMAASVGSDARRGVPAMPVDHLRQQSYGHPGVTVQQQSESISFGSFGNKVNIREPSPESNNNSGFQAQSRRTSNKKKGRGQNQSPHGQSQHGNTKTQEQRSTDLQQQHSTDTHQQQHQQQQLRRQSHEQHHQVSKAQQSQQSQPSQQPGAHHFVQQPFYRYPGGYYHPGYYPGPGYDRRMAVGMAPGGGGGGGGPAYCMQDPQGRQQGQQGSLADELDQEQV
ncbi:hypothetical protein BGX23_001621 [Mortierella sp. AD031]|nr:hypothetical protein BGX23_001621 [Mortierella sp. AD031]